MVVARSLKWVDNIPISHDKYVDFFFLFSLVVIGNRYAGKGKRLMKLQHLMEELEKAIEDKVERTKVSEGFLGYIICSTQVTFSLYFLFSSFCGCECNPWNSGISYLKIAGGSCCPSLRWICSKTQSWSLGIC